MKCRKDRETQRRVSKTPGFLCFSCAEERIKKSKKERATDIPSWAHGSRPKKGESGNEYAIRKMNEHYGKGKWTRKGKQGKEYSELRKWGDRGR